jgi:sulfur carrier protein
MVPALCHATGPHATGTMAAMNIQLNGEPRPIAPSSTIADLLREEGLGDRRVAVEVNGDIVPRGVHATRALAEGDRVEVVHALGGG